MPNNIDVLDAVGATKTLKTTDSGTEHTPHHNVDSVPAPLSTTGGGTEATALRVTLASDSTGVVSVDDNGASLTVDNAALSVVGGGVEATALRVTLASDSTGVLSVDDGGGSLTVDNSGLTTLAAAVYTDDTSTHATGTTTGGLMMAAATPTDGSVDANDIGAVAMSTDRRLHVDSQIVGQDADLTIADGGNSITVDNAALSVTGGGVEATALRVTLANDSTGVVSVDDNGSSLTVDNAALSVTGGGVEATALRVTLASDSTGVLSVDDSGGSLTVDAAELTTIAALSKATDAVAGGSDTGIPAMAIRDDSLTALTPADGDYVPLRVNSTGALHVTGGGGGTQYNVDDVAGGTDTGTALLAVRDDALTTLTPADGDYTTLRVSSTGALHVTGGGGGTEYTDDTSTHATGSTVGAAMMAAAVPTDTTVDANDMGVPGMSLDRRLWTDTQIVGQDADLTIADGGNSITVDNTALSVTGGGVEATALRVTLASDSTGVLSVDDNGGSLTVDSADLTTLAALSQAEDAAHTTADTGIMALAVRKATPVDLSGADGDYEPLQVDNGRLWTQALAFSTANTTWVANGAINADYTSSELNVTEFRTLWLDIEIDSTSDPIGVLYIQGAIASGATFVNLAIDDGKMLTDNTTAITHVFGTDPTAININDPAAAATILVGIKDPPPFIKVFYDSTSGGSATGIDIGYVGLNQ